MKKIEDYLHLYLGCEVVFNQTTSLKEKLTIKLLKLIDDCRLYNVCKPILRPLSDMTEEEDKEYYSAKAKSMATYRTMSGSAAGTVYLLSKHFDLFGLIEAGLAIDKTTLK